MRQEQLDELRKWFFDYVRSFYCDDDYINANIELKELHSKRVCEEMLYLADSLRLEENQKLIALATALLHDVGRFEQFVKYKTYNDPRSINHSQFGVGILKTKKILDCLDAAEKGFIEKAILYHGEKRLPKDLNGDCLLYSKLIRDADKIDIYYVVTSYYKQYRDNPEDFHLEVELPDVPEYSENVLHAVLNGERIMYNQLKTWSDMKLMQLGWVYDINFSATFERIKQRKLLEKVLEFLPENKDMADIRKKIFEYVNLRIEQGQ